MDALLRHLHLSPRIGKVNKRADRRGYSLPRLALLVSICLAQKHYAVRRWC